MKFYMYGLLEWFTMRYEEFLASEHPHGEWFEFIRLELCQLTSSLMRFEGSLFPLRYHGNLVNGTKITYTGSGIEVKFSSTISSATNSGISYLKDVEEIPRILRVIAFGLDPSYLENLHSVENETTGLMQTVPED